mmetsp:Transcript_9090/g.15069  ORF Transcript_9090/g.15069 Transcript_9090/m.15069 type:complete len:318 (-) Transcript_9090:1306-2259(-)|eukprot:CAMPEP_0174958748 /NCGR_PEP_ID=MMETSP0004_2-20121128/2799_1 /TAXON_ID=420556 /ORGANISM="Ochromonas sp., Strain CCMP1393" /LENGTH=317 /DNA_ID=CAMNT_0016207001 /DNA_START=107 /DNA_END=1060 /DNA_ORIENTATION=-
MTHWLAVIKLVGFFLISAVTAMSSNSTTEKPNLVFVKVGKVGGSTFAGVLRRIAKSMGLSGFRDQAWIGHEPGIFANHMLYRDLAWSISMLKSPYILVTLVRNPLERCLSHFYHMEVSRDGVKVSDEAILQYFHNNCKDYERDFIRPKRQPENVSELLSIYDFVGVTERFDESIIALKSLLPSSVSLYDCLYLKSKDSNSLDVDDIGRKFTPNPGMKGLSEDLKQKLLDFASSYMSEDLKIYDMARKKLDSMIAGIPNFQKDLQIYQNLLHEANASCLFDYKDCYWNDNGCGVTCLDGIEQKKQRTGCNSTHFWEIC